MKIILVFYRTVRHCPGLKNNHPLTFKIYWMMNFRYWLIHSKIELCCFIYSILEENSSIWKHHRDRTKTAGQDYTQDMTYTYTYYMYFPLLCVLWTYTYTHINTCVHTHSCTQTQPIFSPLFRSKIDAGPKPQLPVEHCENNCNTHTCTIGVCGKEDVCV